MTFYRVENIRIILKWGYQKILFVHTRVNYGRPSMTDYRQAEWLDDRQTNWLACDQLGPLGSAAMR